MKTFRGFSHDYLSSLFKYNRRTGVLTRRIAVGPYAVGTPVGTVDGKGYLHVSVKRKLLLVHRLAYFLVTQEEPKYVDHKNGDRQDNRLSNLRACTQSQNCGNSKLHAHNTSGYRGVSFIAASRKWHAQIKVFGKQTYLGRFDTPLEAARCYDQAARKHFGSFARLNNA
jgi:ribosomal protein S19